MISNDARAMIRNDAHALIERTMQDHPTWSDDGKCTCGAILPHYGHSADRWREHLATEITDALADFWESEDGEW